MVAEAAGAFLGAVVIGWSIHGGSGCWSILGGSYRLEHSWWQRLLEHSWWQL